jgi:hypothetical protein
VITNDSGGKVSLLSPEQFIHEAAAFADPTTDKTDSVTTRKRRLKQVRKENPVVTVHLIGADHYEPLRGISQFVPYFYMFLHNLVTPSASAALRSQSPH